MFSANDGIHSSPFNLKFQISAITPQVIGQIEDKIFYINKTNYINLDP